MSTSPLEQPEGQRRVRLDLTAPAPVIELARAAMGTIDLDPWATPITNRAAMAPRILLRSAGVESALAGSWRCSDGTPANALLALSGDGATCRRLLKKARREHQAGHLRMAVIWLSHLETATKCPWIWDHLVLVPFRRLRPQAWDEELSEFMATSPSDWSLVICLLPADHRLQAAVVSRFCAHAAPLGRCVDSGPDHHWMEGWKLAHGKGYCDRS